MKRGGLDVLRIYCVPDDVGVSVGAFDVVCIARMRSLKVDWISGVEGSFRRAERSGGCWSVGGWRMKATRVCACCIKKD